MLDGAPRPGHASLHGERLDRHRAQDLVGDPADLPIGRAVGIRDALELAGDQRRRRTGVL
jgi:hypothetical protein